MGRAQHTCRGGRRGRHKRRLPLRSCHRKGCEHCFRSRKRTQRYCQDAECMREVRRWQAAKRQSRRRATKEGKGRHAEAERARRTRRREAPESPSGVAEEATRGHAHVHELPDDFCDRTGCFEPVERAPYQGVRYCGSACRKAVRQVRDRERKSVW
jgi:hypothetical protein